MQCRPDNAAAEIGPLDNLLLTTAIKVVRPADLAAGARAPRRPLLRARSLGARASRPPAVGSATRRVALTLLHAGCGDPKRRIPRAWPRCAVARARRPRCKPRANFQNRGQNFHKLVTKLSRR